MAKVPIRMGSVEVHRKTQVPRPCDSNRTEKRREPKLGGAAMLCSSTHGHVGAEVLHQLGHSIPGHVGIEKEFEVSLSP